MEKIKLEDIKTVITPNVYGGKTVSFTVQTTYLYHQFTNIADNKDEAEKIQQQQITSMVGLCGANKYVYNKETREIEEVVEPEPSKRGKKAAEKDIDIDDEPTTVEESDIESLDCDDDITDEECLDDEQDCWDEEVTEEN